MPSIVDGLFSGRAGLQAHGTAISVLADNIANQNTTGFKAARADFVDLLAGSLGGGGSVSTGNGSSVGKVTRILNQGTFESTGRGLDVAIDGNGFIIVQDGVGSKYFTRAGNLQVNPEGFLLDQNGYEVQGFPANGAGGLTSLNVNARVQQDIQTTTLDWSGNLNAGDPINAVPATITFPNLAAGANFQYTQKVFDSLGASHDVTAYFFKTSANTWIANFYADGGDITAGTPGTPSSVGTVGLTFNASGQLTSAGTTTLAANWSNGSTAGAVDVDLSGFAQFASPNAITSANQNGTGSGTVVGFSVQGDGTLVARLDNGQTSSIGVVALAGFANAEGLQRVGNSLFSQSAESGDAVIGTPGVGIFGQLESGALELSTSDLASDFIKLISLQRGFQGSSRIVSSINDLLNEVVNLGR